MSPESVASIATLLAVLAAVLNQSRTADRLNKRIEDVAKRLEDCIDGTRDILRGEMLRVEQVMDARLRHLEER
jgi:hypothetical protein